MRSLILLPFLAFWVITACTPQVSTSISEEQPEQTEKQDTAVAEKGGCETWNGKSYEDYALEQHVIYRDFLKRGEFQSAYPEWQIAFQLAPAADGQRASHFEDGITLYDHFLQNSTSDAERGNWLDSIMVMYDKMGQCYFDPAYISGRKAFDLYYKYRALSDDRDILDLFEYAMDNSSGESKVFIINPFTALLVENTLDGDLGQEEAREYANKILDLIREKQVDCGDQCEEWKIVAGYAPVQIERLESIRGMFDCDFYFNKYYPDFLGDTSNCDVIERVYIRMNWGGCDKESPEMKRLAEAARKNCTSTSRNETLAKANEALKEGRYREAIDLIEKYIAEEATDNERKATMKMRIANIYYVFMKNYPAARKAALEAARFKSDWGEPYLLIGTLYASSGPLCGPGRGWDSQIVVWPAIDMWNKAKSIDREIAPKANKLINSYRQYMPSVGDIFQRGLKEGDNFFVPCWIQENTRIRAAK